MTQADLKRLLNLKEFRVALAPWPEVTEMMESLCAEPALACVTSTAEAAEESVLTGKDLVGFLSELGTDLWRLKKQTSPSGANHTPDMRRLCRHVDAMWSALVRIGVQVLDHTGELFHHGLALRVISYQPSAEFGRETVETIRPTIYYGRSPVQMGEVIVGIPDPSSALSATRSEVQQPIAAEDAQDERP